LLNYFSYDYAPPPAADANDDNPADDAVSFAVHTETAACPWRPEHRLLRIGLKGRAIDQAGRKAANLVFLLDVSGSMDEPNKLPLVKGAMRLLIDRLTENDRVAIVVYAGASGLVLPPTPGDRKAELHAAIERLQAGGSTNGGQGIELAYQTAVAHFITGGINRVILATDGDFNVGVTSDGDLTRLIEEQAKSGVFLSVLGFGEGNLQDAKMEGLADKGNGNYAYIDTLAEARKVFVEQLDGTLVTIAKDVKLQIEFNPAQVAGYRLIGYENRVLRAEDFADDSKDAGEIGAGHAVTALYEIVPVPQPAPKPAKNGADAPASSQTDQPQADQAAVAAAPTLKYQTLPALTPAAGSGELLTLRLRYKQPDGDTSTPIEFTVQDAGQAYGAASVDFKHAAAVAGFGMLLRGSEHRGNLTWDAAVELADEAQGSDIHGYRAEFVGLVRRAKEIAGE
jgi:Ca-activated chloride channel family protein